MPGRIDCQASRRTLSSRGGRRKDKVNLATANFRIFIIRWERKGGHGEFFFASPINPFVRLSINSAAKRRLHNNLFNRFQPFSNKNSINSIRKGPFAELVESCEQLVEDLDQLARAVRGGDGGEPDDVRVQNRDVLVPRHVDLFELGVERGAQVLPHLHRHVFREHAQQQSLLLGALLLDHQLHLQTLPGLQERSTLLELRQRVTGYAQDHGAHGERDRQHLEKRISSS